MAIKLTTSETEPRGRRRLAVRISPRKLEGGALSSGATIRVETTLVSRNKQSRFSSKKEIRRASPSSERVVGENGGAVEWGGDDVGVLENRCSDQCELVAWFSVLRKLEGRDQNSEKWKEMGRIRERVKIEGLGKTKEMEMTWSLLSGIGGGELISTLTVDVRVAVEEGSGELGVDSAKDGFLRWLSFPKKNNVVGASSDSVELTRSNSLPVLKTRSSGKRRGRAILRKIGSLFSWSRRKVGPVVKKMDGPDEGEKMICDESNENVMWEVKDIVSRDGEVELKCRVGLASVDQCSKEVAGEGACSVIAAVVAHWLLSNKDRLPNRAELAKLMVEGAAEWKKLGENAAYQSGFPDKHFDIETVVGAGIRHLQIRQESSVIGFFSPEKFELLKGVQCIDEIWNNIERNAGVYIVSWNDHFCVLKVEKEACYVIDSLGERLTEGGTKAFILKFDEDSVMRHCGPEGDIRSKPKETSSIAEAEAAAGVLNIVDHEVKVEDEKIICRGRECCKEFFKRFHAAILVRQLEEKGEKSIMCSFDLYKRLQIEFQYTTEYTESSGLTVSHSVFDLKGR